MTPIACQLSPTSDLPVCDAKIAALYGYWRFIHPEGGGLPGRQHFDPLDVPQLLPWIWMLDIRRDPLRFKYRLLGTEQVRLMEADLTGKWLDEVHPEALDAPTFRHIVTAAESGAAFYDKGFPVVHVKKGFTLTERILLPLARNGRDAEILLALTVYHSVGVADSLAAEAHANNLSLTSW